MPEMISIRKFDLSTTTGHMIHFEAGKPVYVPDEAVAHAMGAGCVPVNSVDQEVFDAVARSRVQLSGDLRSSVLHLAIGELVKENNPKKFDGSGVAKHEVLSQRLGFEVFKDETQKAFRTFMAAKKKDEEVSIHKDARMVLDIIDAQSHADLTILASECGVSGEEAAALKTKDLRKLLLSKISDAMVV